MGKYVKSDIEIAQETTMKPIHQIGEKLGLTADDLEQFGKYKAKLTAETLKRVESKENGKLILVTAINPTPAGEGKSTVTVGLGDALNLLGKKSMIAMREPSLGPTMGIKGGATGGDIHKSYRWKILTFILQVIFMRLLLQIMPYLP